MRLARIYVFSGSNCLGITKLKSHLKKLEKDGHIHIFELEQVKELGHVQVDVSAELDFDVSALTAEIRRHMTSGMMADVGVNLESKIL